MLKSIIAGFALSIASFAQAGVIYDADISTGVLFGSGNENGFFVVNKAWKNNQNNIELGLRAKVPYEGSFNSNGAGTYEMSTGLHPKFGAPGAAWNFEFAINLNYDGSNTDRVFDDFLIELSVDLDPRKNKRDWLTFDPVTKFTDNYIGGDNSIAQNSMNIGWLMQDFDPNIEGTYGFKLEVKDKLTEEVLASTRMKVKTVPEPSTLAIFALGILGLASRKFKTNK